MGTPFRDGLSYYYGRDHYCIIDKDGNLLYEAKNDDDVTENILGYGNGKFFLWRSYHSFDKNDYGMVAIDQNGNDVSPEETYSYSGNHGITGGYLCDDLFCL